MASPGCSLSLETYLGGELLPELGLIVFFAAFVIVLQEQVLAPRAYAVALFILVLVVHRGFLLLLYLVLVVRQVDAGPVAEVLVYVVLPLHGQLPSPAVDHALVGVWHREAYQRRGALVGEQYVGAVLEVVVERGAQAVVEHVDVYAVVLLEGFLPRNLGVVLRRLVGALVHRAVFYSEGIAAVVAREGAFAVHGILVGEVHESRAAHLVVAHEAPRGPQLEEAHGL